MGYCIRSKKKTYKGKTYQYYELVKTYRDPNNKKRVVSDFKAHLGKDRQKIKEKLDQYKQKAIGKYSAELLIKMLEKELKNADN